MKYGERNNVENKKRTFMLYCKCLQHIVIYTLNAKNISGSMKLPFGFLILNSSNATPLIQISNITSESVVNKMLNYSFYEKAENTIGILVLYEQDPLNTLAKQSI